jgi:tetratricopeptide (TPR) repeat protein
MATLYHCPICHHEISDPNRECSYCRSHQVLGGANPSLVLLGVGLALLALGAAAGLLTSSFRESRAARRLQHLKAAVALSDAGDHEQAIEEYRHALHYGREDREARLGLARELYHTGRLSEARSHLIDLLQADPTHAEVNYLLARIASAQGRLDQAVAYYRTAIHGRWPEGLKVSPLQVRFELIRVLETKGDQLQEVSELLDLLKEAPEDPSVRWRIGRLLLEAGAPEKAAATFEALVESGRATPQAYEGLGEAEFALGHYLSARTAFGRSLSLDPRASRTLDWLRLTSRVVELDPTYRKGGTRERLRRSEELLDRARRELERCGDLPEGAVGPKVPLPGPAQKLVDAALETKTRRVEAGRSEDYVEADISLAQELWQARLQTCPAIPIADEPLRHVLEKLAQ